MAFIEPMHRNKPNITYFGLLAPSGARPSAGTVLTAMLDIFPAKQKVINGFGLLLGADDITK